MISFTLTHIIIEFNTIEKHKLSKRVAKAYLCFGSDVDYINGFDYISSPKLGWVKSQPEGIFGKTYESILLELGKASDRLRVWKNSDSLEGRKFRITDKTIEEIL